MFLRILTLCCVVLLGACGTTSVGLKYSAPAAVTRVAAPTPVAIGAFADQRGEPTNWLGAIRGGFGNPLKKLESDQPVSEIVKTAFADGLRARGAAAEPSSNGNQLTGSIKKLDCNQMVRRDANVEIEIVVRDSAGQQRFTKLYQGNNVDGSILSMSTGVFASVDDLRVLLEKTLREVVDQALDDPDLRTALQM